MSKLRVAIIGTGMIANSAHFPALNILRKEGLVDVVGVADIRETAAVETAKRHDVPNWYTDPQKMLDELKPDFVAVCTPNMYHKEWTIKALKSGAHVACEKPMALTLADAEEMWQTAKECGKHLFPCQCMRWRNYMQQSKELVTSGELGDVYFSDIEFIRRIGIPTWGMFHMKEHNFGGPFCDLGVHLIDSLLWIVGDKKVEWYREALIQRLPTKARTSCSALPRAARMTEHSHLVLMIITNLTLRTLQQALCV